jgi:hypothetical protein
MAIKVKDEDTKDLAKNICEEFGLEVEFGKGLEGTSIKNGGMVSCNESPIELLRRVVNRINYTG